MTQKLSKADLALTRLVLGPGLQALLGRTSPIASAQAKRGSNEELRRLYPLEAPVTARERQETSPEEPVTGDAA